MNVELHSQGLGLKKHGTKKHINYILFLYLKGSSLMQKILIRVAKERKEFDITSLQSSGRIAYCKKALKIRTNLTTHILF